MDATYGALAGAAERPAARPINLTRLLDMHARGEKIAAVAAHDATFAVAASRAGVECILVGADLAVGYQGHASQEEVTLDALAYHVENVARGLRSAQASAWVICDLPASSYGASPETAMHQSSRLLVAGAHMLRLRVDANFAATAGFLSARGVAVCGQLLGRQTSQRASLVTSLSDSGTKFLVLEGMHGASVGELQSALPQCLTLGLHSGPQTSGQLLSMHALLGLEGKVHALAGKAYLSSHGSIHGAMAAYVADVKANRLAWGAAGDG